MVNEQKEWLPHLADEIISETHGTYLDAYVIALEGWRRGLTLKWHVKDSEKFKEMKTWYVDEPGLLFSLSSQEKTHYFFRTRGDIVSNEAVEFGMDKAKTKERLKQKAVQVPAGKHFSKQVDNETIQAYAAELGYPLVLKPTNGSFGKGVIANIRSEGELNHSLDYVRQELGYDDIVIEQHIAGDDLRLYVIEDRVVGAIKRIPPNVIGDGMNSIEALIALKNEERSLSPRLVSCPIQVDKEIIHFIGRLGYDLTTVPEKGEQVFLSDKANISYGGDPVDVLDELSEKTKETAVKALQAIPGLIHGAVDMLLLQQSETGDEQAFVIELNPTSQLGGILYPIRGKARDVPRELIDYYFPETKGHVSSSYPYFDIKEVLEPIEKKAASITEVASVDNIEYFGLKYIAKGNVQSFSYHRWLRIQALKLSLMGHIKIIDQESIEILVVGNSREVKVFKDIIMDNSKVEITAIEEEMWNKHFKLGFEIQAERKNLIEEIKKIESKKVILKNDYNKVNKKHQELLSSGSWNITLPIRIVTGLIKKIYRTIFKG